MNCGFCKVARGDRIFCKEKHSPKAIPLCAAKINNLSSENILYFAMH